MRGSTLLVITFLESVGTVLLERGLYFYTHDVLGYSELQNLLLAFAFGVTYAIGAVTCHRAARAIGERRLLVATLLSLLVLHAALAVEKSALLLTLGYPLIGALHGIKWPLIESYVSAGHTPRAALAVVGRFNVTWGAAVPLAVAASGPVIASPWPDALFWAAAALNVCAVVLCAALTRRPEHLPVTHPERLGADLVRRYGSLMTAARWSMLASYALLFLLAPLMPSVFSRLGVETAHATAAASLLDVVRVVTFAALGVFAFWRGSAWPLLACVIALPVGFFCVLFSESLALVLLGEVVFGAASGITYAAALYYALVLSNAAVEAGGAHEGLIGLGLALGPLSGIAGRYAEQLVSSYAAGMALGAAPLVVVCAVAAFRALDRRND
jgi:MFS family permease